MRNFQGDLSGLHFASVELETVTGEGEEYPRKVFYSGLANVHVEKEEGALFTKKANI